MPHRDILTIGTSAGGFDALRKLAKEFPAGMEASVLVTIHLSSQFPSALDEILTRSGPLKASFAVDGELVEKSHIYLAPPERHLLIDGERLWLGVGPRENNARPAIDPMFRSAAACCGGRTIGVVLTGTLDDGAAGLATIKLSGGITVVQDPADAAFPQMPTSALEKSTPDHLVRLAEMPALLRELVRRPAGNPIPVPESIACEVEIARNGRSSMRNTDRMGKRSALTCPDCGGVMWEMGDPEVLRYRCHVGHAYTAETMDRAFDDGLRRALASAVRALEERAALMQSLHKRASESGQTRQARTWAAKGCEFENEAEVVRAAMRDIDRIAPRAPRKRPIGRSAGPRSGP